jgi:hypothetical protein
MTNLNDPSANDAIAALTTAIANAVAPIEGRPRLAMKDLHISFVSETNPVEAPMAAAARLLQRGERSAQVEARLATPRGESIAFAFARLDAPDRFALRWTADAPAQAKRGVLRTLWGILESMSA